MENTADNKQKFFALYWGQRLVMTEQDEPTTLSVVDTFIIDNAWESDYLELRTVDRLTDEELFEIGHKVYGHPKPKMMMAFGKEAREMLQNEFNAGIKNGQANYGLIDILRGFGIAIPFMGLSVDQLISYGWVKIVKP